MAFCPFCKGEMGATDIACPHCGYDFPPAAPARPSGFAYSSLADLALTVSMVVAGLSCCGAAYLMVLYLLVLNVPAALFSAAAVVLQLGMLVVFMRVSDLSS